MKKNMMKAVRLVNGYNDDLRVKLPYDYRTYTTQQEKIRDFLLDHILDIYGANIYDRIGIKFNPQPGKDAADYAKLIDFVSVESCNVCAGIYEEEDKTMKNEFIEKILNARTGSYDTAKYRYIVKDCYDSTRQWREIRRLPLDKLDTTAALTEWETVAVIG